MANMEIKNCSTIRLNYSKLNKNTELKGPTEMNLLLSTSFLYLSFFKISHTPT